eukprot:TRINITY_DN5151_c0_g1_i1.p1 TRINITY_DN5151_c0_g1~~TRINITY_DN5151_c0_g1_i1.p1  ORF type:complete len:191 (+),score=41.25 TRINITY_DN5151_c0_g1_i1:63-635(+)
MHEFLVPAIHRKAALTCLCIIGVVTLVAAEYSKHEKHATRKNARQLLKDGKGKAAAEYFQKLLDMLELTGDVDAQERDATLVAQADAYLGLSRSLSLAAELEPALESVMRARKLYALSGTSFSLANTQAVVAGSFESELLFKLDRHREALGSMQGAYKLALEGKNGKLAKQLKGSLQQLRAALGVKDDEL